MSVSKFSVSLYPNVVEEIDRRLDVVDAPNRSGVINKGLDRYFAVLDEERRALIDVLSDAEMGLILDVLNGTLFSESFSIQLVSREIRDSLVDGYAEKWNVDGPALVKKLVALTYPQCVALVDAVERWWNRVAAGENKIKPSEALKPRSKK